MAMVAGRIEEWAWRSQAWGEPVSDRYRTKEGSEKPLRGLHQTGASPWQRSPFGLVGQPGEAAAAGEWRPRSHPPDPRWCPTLSEAIWRPAAAAYHRDEERAGEGESKSWARWTPRDQEWEDQSSRVPQQRRQRQEGSGDRYPSPCLLEAPVVIDGKLDKDRISRHKRNVGRKQRRDKICATHHAKGQP